MEKNLFQKIHWQIIVLLARRLPPCDLIVPVISEARERPLTLREKTVLKLHLFTCEACRRYVEQIERMSGRVKPKEEIVIEASDKLSGEARNRIKAALEAAAAARKN